MRAFALFGLVLACTPGLNPLTTSSTDTGSTAAETSETSETPTTGGATSTATTSDATTQSTSASTTATTTTTTTSDTTTAETGSTSTPGSATEVSSTGPGPGEVLLVVDGLGQFPVTCKLEDADCGARTACELVSGGTCEKIDYDCKLSGLGSYVPPDFLESPEDFSFALYPLEDNFGNICSCFRTENEGKAFLEALGVATDHEWCGLGHWHLEPA